MKNVHSMCKCWHEIYHRKYWIQRTNDKTVLLLILRLLDNNELGLEQVNNMNDFVEDHVEHNQVPLCFIVLICLLKLLSFLVIQKTDSLTTT